MKHTLSLAVIALSSLTGCGEFAVGLRDGYTQGKYGQSYCQRYGCADMGGTAATYTNTPATVFVTPLGGMAVISDGTSTTTIINMDQEVIRNQSSSKYNRYR